MRRVTFLCGGLLAILVAAPAGLASTVTTAAAAASDGALVGVWPDQNTSTLDTADESASDAVTPGQYLEPPDLSDIPAMNAWQGKPNSILNFYDSIDPNAQYSELPLIWDDYHAVPMMTLSYGGTDSNNSGCCTNQEVAAGADDSSLLSFGQALYNWINNADVLGNPAPAGGRRVYLRLNWEANGDWGYGWQPAGSSTDCATLLQQERYFAAAWRRVHDVVMSAGLKSTQVQWVFSVNGFDYDPVVGVGPGLTSSCSNGAQNITANIFPGDAYIDWTGIDGYSDCSLASVNQDFDAMVSELRSLSKRPVSVDEVGASTTQLVGSCNTAAVKGQWVASYLSYLQQAGIKMSVWFNANIYENGEPTDWAIFSKAHDPADIASTGDCTYTSAALVTYNAYCEYARGLASSYYASIDPNNPRVIDDAEFQGTWTPAVTGTVPGAAVISATGQQKQVSLLWSTPANGGTAITGYSIYRGTAAGGETLYQSVPASTSSYVDKAVTPGVTYYYEVEAVNAAGTAPPSNEASAVPTDVPSAPGGLRATTVAGPGGGVELTWSSPDPNGLTITGYELYRGTTAGGEVPYLTLGPNTNYLDTAVAPATMYYYRVAAINADGTGPESNEAAAQG